MPHTVTVTSSLGAPQIPDLPRPPRPGEGSGGSNGPAPRQNPEDYVERPQNYTQKQRRLKELKDRRKALQEKARRQMRTGSGRKRDRISEEVLNELSSVKAKVPAMKVIVPQNPGTVAIVTRTGEGYNRSDELQAQVSKGVIDTFYYTPAGAEKKPAITPGNGPGSPVERPAQTRTDALLMYGEKPLADVREQVAGVPFVAGVLQPSLQEVQSIRDTGRVPERAKQNLSGAAGASFGGTGLILLAGVAFAGYEFGQ